MDIDHLMARHLSGTATPREERALREWIAEDPARARELEALRDAWAMAGGGERSELPLGRYGDPAEAWAEFLARTRSAESKPAPRPALHAARATGPRRPAPGTPREHPSSGPADSARRNRADTPALARRTARFTAVAAGLAMIAAAGLLLRGPIADALAPAPYEYATRAGERRVLALADGSRLTLGPGSRVRIAARFRRARAVELAGTAHFDVAPDPDRPFIVRAAGSETRVLGTRFVIRAFADEPVVQVAVEEGRVSFGPADGAGAVAVTLSADQAAEAEAGAGATPPRRIDPEALLAWTRGRLVFRDRPLEEIARELERWYGVEIRIADPTLTSRKLTLSSDADDVRDVLGVLAHSLGVSVGGGGGRFVLGGDPARLAP